MLHNLLFFNSIAVKFPYLVQKKLKPGQEVRRVTQLDWKNIESDLTKPFMASGLQFVPLPVSYILFLFPTIVLFYLKIVLMPYLYTQGFLLFIGDAW